MTLLSYIRQSFTARITLWVVSFATVIMCVILLFMGRFIHMVGGAEREMMLTAVAIAVVSLLVLFVLTWRAVGHHLHPLDMLATSAQRIANGDMENTVPEASHPDEIGQLQTSFSKMQRALTDYITEMQQKRDTLNRQNQALESAYAKAREADGMKALFLSRMTSQMSETVEAIDQLSKRLCDHYTELSKAEQMQIRIEMLNYTDTVTRLLDQTMSPQEP